MAVTFIGIKNDRSISPRPRVQETVKNETLVSLLQTLTRLRPNTCLFFITLYHHNPWHSSGRLNLLGSGGPCFWICKIRKGGTDG